MKKIFRNGELEKDEYFKLDKNINEYYKLYIISQILFYIIISLFIIILVYLII